MGNELKTLQDILNYLNEILIIHGENQLDITQLTEIQKIALTLSALEKAGTTTDNYGTKRKAYYHSRNKFFDNYGIEITDSFPFSNPKDLYTTIDNILIKAGLNAEQRKYFYYETGLRRKSPKKRSPKKGIFENIEVSQLEKLHECTEEEDSCYSLSQEEQDEIIGITPEERQSIFEEQEAQEKYYREKLLKKQHFKRLKYIPTT